LGAFLARLKDFITSLRSVNEIGGLSAICCKFVSSERSVQILDNVDMRWNVESQFDSLVFFKVLKISPIA
jgi:hypothetical protein